MHTASSGFWKRYNELPLDIQKLAKLQFELLKVDPNHPSLHLKKINSFWSVRVNQDYRALGKEINSGMIWFWIGSHKDYDKLIG